MTRPAAPRPVAGRLAAAAVALAVLLPPVPAPAASRAPAAAGPVHRSAAGARAADESPPTPLRVTLDTLSPAEIPARGQVTVTGEITNRSDETWTALNVYLLTSPEPITSRAALADAAESDAATQVGERRAAEGLYARAGDLPPGATASYRLALDRADLEISGQPGVYWVGVHVLGAVDGVRDSLADGRARTFMPLLPDPGSTAGSRARTSLALVLPFREPVRRGGAARLADLPTWERELAPEGRLDRLLRLSGRSRGSLTWLVDPSVLDAVQSVAQGNPPLDIGAAPPDGPDASPAPSQPGAGPSGEPGPSGEGTAEPDGAADPGGSADPSGTGGEGADGAEEGESDGDEPSAAAARARSWLEEFRRQAPTHAVTTLPYGDLDVAAALADDRKGLVGRATRLSATGMAAHGVARTVPVVAPSSGYLPASALPLVGAQRAVLLADSALPGSGTTVVRAGAAPPVVLTDTAAGSGGPLPNPRYAALPVRQRVLSDAALHALSPDRDEPLVVRLPDRWDPGGDWRAAAFFAGLDRSWLRLVDVPAVAAGRPGPPSGTAPDRGGQPGSPAPEPRYPDSELAAEVPAGNLASTVALIRTGRTFATVLTGSDTVEDAVARQALLGSSAAARADPDLARRRTTDGIGYLRSQMSGVHVVGPPFVMMSGESGPIQVTLVNDLEQTVTVGLESSTPDARLSVSEVDPVTLGPGRRTSIRLQASSSDIGVHSVTLRVVDVTGAPLGSETRFSVRTSNVSTVIWVVMAVGGALLLVAVVVRLYRRVRRRGSTHGPLLPRDSRPGQGLEA